MSLTYVTLRGKRIAALLVALMLLSPPAGVLAAGPASSTDQQRKIDQLTKQIEEMQRQQQELIHQVKELQTQVAIPQAAASPGAAGGAPEASATPAGTVGEQLSKVQKDLSETRSDLAKNLGVNMHGLVDATYEHNFNQPIGEVNALRTFDNNDGFQLTQGNIHIEKDGGVGFVTDLNFGQVAESLQSGSHFSNSPTVDAFSGKYFDPTQVYLTYTVPIGSGINVQAGRFVTLLDAEIIPNYTNQNYNETRDYIFGLGSPFTHTGVRASYTFNDYVAATVGMNNGWDDPGNINNGGPNYEGEIVLNNKDKSLAFTLNGIYGPNLIGHSNSYLGAIDPIVTIKPPFLPNTTLITEYLYASETGPVVNGHSATWQGVSQYFVWDINEQWESATRGEMFDDEDGARSGFHQTLWDVTQTFSFKVPQVDGLLARLEYRHDQSNHHVFFNNNFISPVTLTQHMWKGQDTLLGALIYAF